MDAEIKEFIMRGVSALERLADDPVIQMEVGPPVCPFCQESNPKVRVHESEAEGKLGEFIIQSHCLHCNNVFYAMPLQWECARSVEEADAIQRERAEVIGHGIDSRKD